MNDPLLKDLRAAAREASAAILAVYASDFEVWRKSDQSPVTLADRHAEEILLRHLEGVMPGVPVFSEEQAEAARAAEIPPAYWLVDPLDGTKEFVARTGEFSINLGFVEGRYPMIGMVHLPLEDATYAASAGAAWRQRGEAAAERISARRPPPTGLVVVHSRSHANSPKLAAWLADYNVAERLHAGSAAKFCLVAAGDADVYPRLGPTSEWDTAAGQALVEAAGGRVSTLEGERLAYGKPRFLNDSFVVRGRE